MEIVKTNSFNPARRVIALALFFIMPVFLVNVYAQQISNTSYIVTEDGLQVFQTITFPAVTDVEKYEIEIEIFNESGDAEFVEKVETDTNSFTVSLKAGSYRYKVFAYNRMTLLDGMSEWQDFIVLPIVEPVMESYQPFYGMYYEMADPDGTLIVYGSDFFSYSEFALVRKGAVSDWLGVQLDGRRDVIIPNHVTVSGNMAVMNFPAGSVRQGMYEIFIRNPGGLWSVFGEVHVGYKRSFDFTFSSGYSPMIAGFDIENAVYSVHDNATGSNNYFQQLDVFNPLGYYFRLGWLPFKTNFFKFGFEFEFYFLMNNYDRYWMDDSGVTGLNSFFGLFKGVSLDFLMQFQLTERWQHNLRFGAGISQAYHDYIYVETEFGYPHLEHYSPFPFDFNIGYSTQFFLIKNLFLEAGLKLQYTVSFDSRFPLNHLSIFPSIGLGWQFGRWTEYTEVSEGAKRAEDYSIPVTRNPQAEHLLSFGWSPMIPLFGLDLYGKGSGYYAGRTFQFLDNFNPAGFEFSYAYFPHRWSNNKLGIGIDFYMLEHKNRDKIIPALINPDLVSHLLFNIRYQRVLTDNWQIGVHAGLGISNSYIYKDSFAGVSLAADAGVSVQYFVWKDLFVEAAVDLIFLFSDKTSALLRPGISVGWQFRRNNETGLRLPGHQMPAVTKSEAEQTAEEEPEIPEAVEEPAPAEIIEEQPEENDENDENDIDKETESAEFVYQSEETPEKQARPVFRLLIGQSNRYNSFGLSLGTSFADPAIIASVNVTFSPIPFLFFDIGIDMGFISVYEDVKSYLSVYPFINAGFFLPFLNKGGIYISAGVGFLKGNYAFEYGNASVDVVACNFTAGINIENFLNISYTLKTDFKSVGNKLSVGYVFRLE